jgi:hypothetical protein
MSSSPANGMYQLLNRIMTKGKKVVNERKYISELLFRILTDYKEFDNLTRLKIQDVQYIDIDSIPQETLDSLGLLKPLPTFSTEACDRKLTVEYITPQPLELPKQRDGLAESDIDRAIAKAKTFEHEFIDHFIDARQIEIKALTLSVLQEIKPFMSDKNYLKSVFTVLNERNIECELPLGHFKKFYLKLKWFCRVGFVNGCININKNPYL